MIIKVCGMRDEQNIKDVAALGIDMMGLIFWPKSSRYVQMISSRAGIIPDYSEDRLKSLVHSPSPDSVEANTSESENSSFISDHLHSDVGHHPLRVGVFVDDMPQNIITRVYNYELDFVQLHGNESREMIENLKATLIPDIQPNIKVIKAISIHQPADVDKYKEYEGVADLFLFDTKCKTVGGSGLKFDWSVLDRYDGDTPFLLSGGIGPEDAERVKAFRHPKCIGIDLNSKFEDEPGLKNVEKLRKFIADIRAKD